MTPRRRRSRTTSALTGVSRRRFLGGTLAAALAATLLRSDRAPRPVRKPIWIGHC